MKFSFVHINKEITNAKNLGEINLTKKPLGSTVALIGKNGAGKSRVLEYVSNYLEYISPKTFLDEHIQEIPDSLRILVPHIWTNLEQSKTNVSKLTRQERHINNVAYSNFLQNANHAINFLKRYAKKYIKVVDTDDIKKVKQSISNGLSFDQILKNSHLAIDINQSKEQIFINEFQEFNNTKVVEYLSSITSGLILQEFNFYLKYKDSKEFSENTSLVNEKMSELEIHRIFSKFQSYIKSFLGKDFSYQSHTNDSTLTSTLYYNGQPFKLDTFSPGQKTLFAYAVLLFYLDISSGADLDDSIIFIDEPELHLHPEAQIKLIDALKKITQNKGQLWIATHSINILSHLSYDEILMLKDDEIILPSRLTPGNSYSELMGLEDHIIELQQFISSTNEWAYSNFMAQCFKNPDVIFNTNTNDPQYLLFKEFIKDKKELYVLDFGAGKGRMGYTLSEDRQLHNKIHYFAYEPDTVHHKSLTEIPDIEKVTQDSKEILSNSIDIVLLCNVLHEISPKSWKKVFTEIERVLSETGYLVVIEDLYLPKGENAHEYGYLILDDNQLKKIFNQKNILRLHLKDQNYAERIIFCAIKQEQINLTDLSIHNALTNLKEGAYDKIKSLRKTITNISEARIYANYTQLYINATLALDDLGNPINRE